MTAPLVSLLTDFGLADPSVPICKGVILGIAPEATLLDVSHQVTPQAVAEGAALLWAALPYLPVGIVMAVVDPGVGTARRAVALRVARGDYLVGPDNGLLVAAAERLGGVTACHVLERPEYRLATVSATFHGRDIFAPAAAHLARGVALEAFGRALDPAALVRLPATPAAVVDGALEADVAFVDTFGNVQLLAGQADLEAAVGPLSRGTSLAVAAIDDHAAASADVAVAPAARAPRAPGWEVTWQMAYGDVEPGEPLLGVDSYGRLALAVNLGHAAERFGLRAGRRLRIRRA